MSERNKDRATDQTTISASMSKLLKAKLTETAQSEGKPLSKWLVENLENILTGTTQGEELPADTKHKLNELSLTIGLPAATLTDIAIRGLLDYVKVNGGKLPLPIEFPTVFSQLDQLASEAEAAASSLPIAAEDGELYN